jgi:phage terminase large subunit
MYTKGVAGDPVDPATGRPIFASYSWDVFGNPVYPREELDLARAKYGEDHPVYQEQYLGKWTFQHGRVYGMDFDATRNVMDPRDIPKDWRRIRAIDFGYRDPFVCLWFAITPDSELWLYREYYHPGRAMAHHAQAIRELSQGEHILYTVADSSEPQSIADLRRLGVPAIEAKRDRRAGRMLVGDYLRSGRLRFVRGACPNLIREISWYHWDEDKNKEGAKEATLGDDHAMDAMRYAIMSRPVPAQQRVRRATNTFDATLGRRTRQRQADAWAFQVAR